MLAQFDPVVVPDRDVSIRRLGAIASILRRPVVDDVLNLSWETSGGRVHLFRDEWASHLGIDLQDEASSESSVVFAAYVWLVHLANYWESYFGDGSFEHEDLAWEDMADTRDYMSNLFESFAEDWGFPSVRKKRCDGTVRPFFEWSSEDRLFSQVACLVSC